MTTDAIVGKPVAVGIQVVGARSSGIDSYKFIAFIAVVFIHTSHAIDVSGPSLVGLLDQFSRFAVPFFFLTSGYFLGLRDRTGLSAFTHRATRILTIFAFWSTCYVLLAHPVFAEVLTAKFLLKWALSGGPGYHLWFLPSLLICLGTFLALLAALGPTRALYAAIGLYILGVAFGSYRTTLGLPDTHFNMHNGPFFGTLFVALGHSIAKKSWSIPFRHAMTMAALGAAIQVSESMALDRLGTLRFAANEFSFGTVPFAVGVLFLALNTKRGLVVSPFSLQRLGQLSLGLYCVHVAYIWLFEKLFNRFGFGEVLELSGLVVAASVASVLLLARIPALQRFLQ